MSKAIVMIDIPTDYADEYKQWIIDGRLYYLEDGAWTFLKEVEYKVEPYREAIAEDTLQLNLRVPSNEIVKAVENSVIDTLYAKPTVKAIPVEWILKYRRNNRGEITYYSIDAIDHMLSEWCEESNIDMWDMINGWEKENEEG